MTATRSGLDSCLIKILFALLIFWACNSTTASGSARPGQRQVLADGWKLRSAALVQEDGHRISRVDYRPKPWLPTAVPSTVLTALVKNGIYPDPRMGLNCYRIPDASDEFNRKHDLAQFSYLPDRRNPWRDPYWYRTEFDLPPPAANQHVWLNFQCINYRGEVWLNGVRIAGPETMVGMFQRFRLDITSQAQPGRNALAVKIFPVDHPGEPDRQLQVFGPERGFRKDIMKDVTEVMTIGYDCMMTVPDRNMGLCQEVFLDWTGPVDLRHPFVVTDLALPDTSRATLGVSAELVNLTALPVKGVLRGQILGTDVRFEQPVELRARETRLVHVKPRPVLNRPRLWWPIPYGDQPLYDLVLGFDVGHGISTEEKVTFGVRKITTELHQRDGAHGRRLLVNGQKIFCRGGYIQPELMLDWDPRRMDTEIRYFADANLNLIFFEDIPNPPEAFLEACDRRGVLFGNCFYGCYWLTPGSGRPDDLPLLEQCTIDLVKRYRNHPSLVLYMAMNEGDTREDVYEMWRRHITALDGTRFWIPSGTFGDARGDVPAWFKKDLPAGMNDLDPKSYTWKEPATYFRWVRQDRSWMFKIESGSASLPPISSLARFLPDLGQRDPRAPFPLTQTWAHHGANHYYQDYDRAIRRLHGEPDSVADYCWKAHLVTADQHRAFFEAVNHRMWDLTSGFTEWKINSCYPDVQWQNFDYYHKPVVSHFYIKKACQPLHVQMDPIDFNVGVINCRLQPQAGLEVTAIVFDLDAKTLWQRTARLDIPGNACREVFTINGLPDLARFLLVKLELRDAAGRLVADNFYWLPGRGTESYEALQRLPLVKLETALEVESLGEEKVVHVKVANPTKSIAFFMQLALTRGPQQEEILPVFWQDNYFSLQPGEIRKVSARIQTRDLRGGKPVLEVGGWNIDANYACRLLKCPKDRVKVGEPLMVTADITNTFLDGSRVALRVNGQVKDAKWSWARGNRTETITFTVCFSKPGPYQLTVGERTLEVKAE